MNKTVLKILILGAILLAFPLLNFENTSNIPTEEEKSGVDKNYLLGKFDPSTREDFGQVPAQFTVFKNKIYLRKETLNAFLQMREDAEKDGTKLNVDSATRNFDYQKTIWNNKWTGATLVGGKNLSKSIQDGQKRFEKILEYSAAPGTSRHHWGTDIDINAATTEYFLTAEGKRVYDWLGANAYRFGFCQVYNLKGSSRPRGYNEEKWHWSYMPLSKKFMQAYKSLIKDSDISGFLGEEFVSGENLIDNYALSINPDCL